MVMMFMMMLDCLFSIGAHILSTSHRVLLAGMEERVATVEERVVGKGNCMTSISSLKEEKNTYGDATIGSVCLSALH